MGTLMWRRGLIAALLGTTLLVTSSCGEDGGQETGGDEAHSEAVAEGEISMAEVEEHDSPESCWAVIEDVVYDLTDWIDEHPGGAGRIEQLCGTDATSQFQGQHDGADAPQEQLAEMEIGELAP